MALRVHIRFRSANNAQELCRVRFSMIMTFLRLCVPPVLVMILLSALEFLRRPSFCSASWFCCPSLVLLLYGVLVKKQLPCTPWLLHRMRPFFSIVNIVVGIGSAWGNKDDFPGRFGIILTGQVLMGLVFPADAKTLVNSLLHTIVYIWSAAQIYGESSLNQWWFVFLVYVQTLVCGVFPFVLEFTLRDCVKTFFESQDSDSLISGFRQMLRGICDGELLVDSNLRICGGAPCLQRLLASQEEFAGRCFRDLIDGEEAQQQFDGFLVPAVPEDATDLRPNRGAPRCLRVALKAPSGQVVPVDVFHVALPCSLYAESTNYHLWLGIF